VTTPEFTLEHLTRESIPEAVAAAALIWPLAFEEYLPPGQVEYMLAMRSTEEFFDRYINVAEPAGPAFLLVRLPGHDGPPAAYLSYRPEGPDELRLEQLYVQPQLHGSGLADSLMAHVLGVASTCHRTRVSLTVNRNNRRAIAFYQRCGFAVESDLVADIGADFVMDDHVMVRSL
jgi:ribosomal protein S18 acetylase RimI-like enzyme